MPIPKPLYGMEVDGRLAGSVFLSEWGNFVFCGPLSIDPAFWGQGAGALSDGAGYGADGPPAYTLAGSYGFPHSLQHISLYQKYGFRPRMLTTLFVKPVVAAPPARGFDAFAGLVDPERDQVPGGVPPAGERGL